MPKISRRRAFQGAVGGAVGGAVFAPQVLTGQQGGRRFKAFVRYKTGAQVEELRLTPLGPRDVVVRTEASGVCYTIVAGTLATTNVARPNIPNHSGMGIVDEVGSQVQRVKKGDRVIVPGTPQCGTCYHCLQGRSDWCQFLSTAPARPMAEMSDGTPVYESGALGGLSELMVVPEEYCCPVFTDLPAEHLTMLGDTIGTGLAAAHNLFPVEPGHDVVVMGCGPVGLGGVIGAKVASAAQIIAVEPIKYRRDVAMQVGATMALDPNVEGTGLVEKIRELCKGKTDRKLAGGRAWGDDVFAMPRGPDVTIEAVGGETMMPKVERGPDPTGLTPLRQAWEMTRGGGHIIMLSFAQKGDISFPTSAFVNRGRTLHAGQQGGLNMMRDLPRYVRLMEKGVIDMSKIVTRTYPLERTKDAVQDVADRTVLGAAIKFPI